MAPADCHHLFFFSNCRWQNAAKGLKTTKAEGSLPLAIVALGYAPALCPY